MTFAYIPSPSSNGFYVGPFFLHWYGISYVFAVTGAIIVTRILWRERGGDPDLVYEVALWGFPAGLIGGRIYFLITTPSQVPPEWWGPFAIWKGGLGIWGGIAGGVIGGLFVLRRRLPRYQILRFCDAVAPGLLVAQSFGRIGNYFNQELFGAPSKLPWALKIDRAHRVAELAPRYWRYSTFEPTFLYEIIWNLSLAVFLVWLGRHRRIKPPGIFALYVVGYCAFRIFEETQRIDYSNYFLGMRVNFWVAMLLGLFGVFWFVAIQRGWRAGLPGAPRRVTTTVAAPAGPEEPGAKAPALAGAGSAGKTKSPSRPPARRSGGRQR